MTPIRPQPQLPQRVEPSSSGAPERGPVRIRPGARPIEGGPERLSSESPRAEGAPSRAGGTRFERSAPSIRRLESGTCRQTGPLRTDADPVSRRLHETAHTVNPLDRGAELAETHGQLQQFISSHPQHPNSRELMDRYLCIRGGLPTEFAEGTPDHFVVSEQTRPDGSVLTLQRTATGLRRVEQEPGVPLEIPEGARVEPGSTLECEPTQVHPTVVEGSTTLTSESRLCTVVAPQ